MNASSNVLPTSRHKFELSLLAIILLVAAVLRFYGLDWSFSNDELSALSRLSFDSFGQLINQGVKVDFHPALVQVFLWGWTVVFGVSEYAVRAPFVLLGIGSIVFVYRVGRLWFGSSAALFAAAGMAGLQYFILYSQLARPYSPGLFFTWWMMFHWSTILKGRGNVAHGILGGLATALAMYTHYFSFMQVCIVGGIGIFMLNKKNFKFYAISAGVAAALWLPHLNVTLHHLSKGGVGTWLGPPESDFLWKYLLYVFNSTEGILIGFVLLAILAASFGKVSLKPNRWQAVALILFLTPFLIGFYYSRWINPVLQYSTLIFAAPNLLLLLFSGVQQKIPKKITVGMVLVILTATSLSTVVVNRYYSSEDFGVFKELALKVKSWDNQHGETNTLKIGNFNSPAYLAHYFKKIGHPAALKMYNIETDSSLAVLRQTMQASDAKYLAFAWSTRYVPLETYEVIRQSFPNLIEADKHFNSGVYLFGRDGKDERTPLYSKELISIDTPGLDSLTVATGFTMDANMAYSMNFEKTMGELQWGAGIYVVAHAMVESPPETKLTLVIEYQTPTEEGSKWYGNDLHPGYSNASGKGQQLTAVLELPELVRPEDIVKIYLWKQSPDTVVVRSFSVKTYPELP